MDLFAPSPIWVIIIIIIRTQSTDDKNKKFTMLHIPTCSGTAP